MSNKIIRRFGTISKEYGVCKNRGEGVCGVYAKEVNLVLADSGEGYEFEIVLSFMPLLQEKQNRIISRIPLSRTELSGLVNILADIYASEERETYGKQNA